LAVKRYSGTSWVTEAGAAAPLPSGMLAPYAGATAPTGWLICDGGTFSATAYPQLAAVLGSTYGTISGDNYRLPDLRGRTVAGKDSVVGTSAANRITSGVSGVTATTLGATGGDERLHQHSHPNSLTSATVAASGHTHNHFSPIGLNSGTNMIINPGSSLMDGLGSYNIYDIQTGSGQYASAGTVTYERWYVTSSGPSADTTVGISNANNTQTGTSQNLPPTIVLNYIIKV
jgi:microcystin-dependent protein